MFFSYIDRNILSLLVEPIKKSLSLSDVQMGLLPHGVAASMSRAGNCYDNAVAESLFSSFKDEETLHQRNLVGL